MALDQILKQMDGAKKKSSEKSLSSKISLSKLSSSFLNRSKIGMSSHLHRNDISDITELSLTYENNTDASSP